MRRLLVLSSMLLLLSAVPASAGGGGCHDSTLTDQAATSVTLSGSCFAPTVVRVAPGDTVTFRNADPYPHRIDAAAGTWGTKTELLAGEETAFRFARAGTFPYSCYLHPTMTGAVVVGDG